MNGAAGRRVYGFSSAERTANVTPSSSAASSRACASSRRARSADLSSPSWAKSRPCATRLPSSAARRASKEPGSKMPLDVPVAGGDEGAALALALDDEPHGDRLHAPGGEALHDLLPEHRRDLVAVEPVEDAPRLLRVDEPLVDLARLPERALDRVARDLVEDHPADRHLRLQLLEQVPGDRLALAVFVRREQELVGVLELALQVGDDAASCRRRRCRAARSPSSIATPSVAVLARASPSGCPTPGSGGRGCGRCSTRRR